MSARVWVPVPESMNCSLTSYLSAYSELVLNSLVRVSKIARTLSEPVAHRFTTVFLPSSEAAGAELSLSFLAPQPDRAAISMTAVSTRARMRFIFIFSFSFS